jgi:Right handed beta helix region/Secretion system C-terminal sorting domain/IPT/TIG domain
MKYIYLFLLIGFSLKSEAQELPLQPAEISGASSILCGEVYSLSANWNSSHTMINTKVKVLITDVLRGNLTDTATLVFIGGQVGNDLIVSSLSPKLNVGMQVFFMLNTASSNGYYSITARQCLEANPQNKQMLSDVTGSFWRTSVSQSARASSSTIQSPVIQNFAPTQTPAGTGTLLSIRGTGFGTTRGNGVVKFTNARLEGFVRNTEPYPSDYLVWNDTLIQVRVPGDGYQGTGVAGTGLIEVVTDLGGSTVSSSVLTVPYAVLTIGISGTPVIGELANDNGSGGYSFFLDDSLFNRPNIRQSFFSALQRWRCGTGVNFEPVYTGSAIFQQAANDGVSIVRFDSLSQFVFGYTLTYYSVCSGNWTLTETDIVFNRVQNWYYGQIQPAPLQYDFESTAMKLIGFALQLGPVLNANDVMDAAGAPQGGRIVQLLPDNIQAAGIVMNLSTLPNTCGPLPHQSTTNCFVGPTTDASAARITWPRSGFCQGNFPVRIMLVNRGSDTLTSLTIGWRLNMVLQTPLLWNGQLIAGDSIELTLGNSAFIPGAAQISAWTILPSPLIDTFTDNDTSNVALTFGSCTSANAGVIGLNAPTVVTCLGNNPVIVAIRNYATTPLNYVQINWAVNNVVQQPVIWTGNLPSNTNSSFITLGTFNFTLPLNALKFWTSTPNGLADAFPFNDTLNSAYNPVGMNGVYTVGGVSPNYTTLQAALSDISSRGVCTPVTLNLRPGTYSGAMTVNLYNGSPIRSIVIQAENGDSSSVIITHGSGTVLSITNTKYVTLRKLTIQQTSSSGFDAVQVSGNSSGNITVENCVILQPVIATSSFVHGVYFNTSVGSDSFVVRNCRIENGSYGIRLTAPTDTFRYCRIENNIISNMRTSGITVGRTNRLVITDNRIATVNAGRGIEIGSTSPRFVIMSNNISTVNQNCIRVSFTNLNVQTRGRIVNNFLKSQTGIALTIDNATYIDIDNNNILTNQFSCIEIIYNNNIMNYAGNNRLRNNVLANNATANGQIFVFPITSPGIYQPFSESYNNAYSVASGSIGEMAWGDKAFTLYEWILNYSIDSSSVTVPYPYVSGIDLHLKASVSNIPLWERGAVQPGTTTDIDGDLRGQLPDIGADEFSVIGLDAAIERLEPATKTCTGPQLVKVKLFNMGNTTLTSAVIAWTVNNIAQPSFNWTGNLLSKDSTGLITIGNYNFPSSAVAVKVWVWQPNALTDGRTTNDTLQRSIQGGALSGIYTIGGVSPNYTTFTAARNALANNGICGPVTFHVRPGTYNEQVALPVVTGASSINRITFEAENGDSSSVILQTTSTTSAPLTFTAGAAYYRINRISITGGSIAVHLGKNYFIRINNCKITGTITALTGTANYDTEIDHSRLTTIALESQWLPGRLRHERINIHHNQILGTVNINYHTQARLDNNIMTNSSFSATTINASGQYELISMSGNLISPLSISSISVYLTLDLAPVGFESVVANNMLNTSDAIGINLDAFHPVALVHNTFVLSANSNSHAVYLSGNHSGGRIRMQNNCFVGKQQAFAFGTAFSPPFIPGTLISNNNNFYADRSDMFALPYISLQNWQLLTGGDQQSVSVQPQFVSSTDLHLYNDFQLFDSGTPLAGITTDIDEQPRSPVSPSIGADEAVLVLSQFDAGLTSAELAAPYCSGGSYPVHAKIRNFGSLSLNSAVINWSVNSVLQQPLNWSGNLASLDTTGWLNIGQTAFLAPDTLFLKVWCSSPNQQTDANASNDTLGIEWVVPKLSGTYTVGGSQPDFVNYDDFVLYANAWGICGPVTVKLRPGTYVNSNELRPNGASSVNSITIESETGNNSLVTFSSIYFEDAIYQTYKHITFNTYITLDQGCHNLGFQDCVFEYYLDAASYVEHHLSFRNCLFKSRLSLSVLNNAGPEYGNEVINNVFTNCAQLTLYKQNSLIVSQNTFTCNTASSNTVGLDLVAAGDSVLVERNQITGQYSIGLRVNSTLPASTQPMIVNNMIAGGSNMSTGIELSGNTNPFKLYYNNVNTTQSTLFCTSLLLQSTEGEVKNNIFVNSAAQGYAVYSLSPFSQPFSSDHNVLYTNNSSLARWGNTICTTLSQYQSASGGLELNSLNINPIFVTATDLHVLNTALDSSGILIPGIVNDFDGDIRLTVPDIGADERNFFTQDAGVTALVIPIPACEGQQQFTVELKNFATQPLTSVLLKWSINGIPQSAVNWTGSLITGGSVAVTLGNYTLLRTTPVILDAWTEQPNGQQDLNVFNDSLQSLTVSPRMQGNFTIGGTLPDYPDFTSASADLVQYGICGPVTFDVRNGTYNEQFTIDRVAGSSAVNTITFRPQSGDSTQVILQWSGSSSDNYIARLRNAEYITFTKLTWQALNNNYCRSVEILDSCSYLQFTNNLFLSPILPVSSTAFYFDNDIIHADVAETSRSIMLSGNLFRGAAIGIFGDVSAAIHADSSLLIVRNQFENQLFRGITLSGHYYAFIDRNRITSTQPLTTYAGIETYIFCNYAVISNNRIEDIPASGMLLKDIPLGKVYNNFVSTYLLDSVLTNSSAVGLLDAGLTSIVHNTFIAYGTRRYSSAFSATLNTPLNDIRNNIFACYMPNGVAVNYNQLNLNNSSTINNNVYFSCGDTLIITNNNSGSYWLTDLQQWQNFSPFDANSKEIPPPLISFSEPDIISGWGINNGGAPIPGVTTDINGQLRNISTPDIGAVELIENNDNAAAVCVKGITSFCSGGNVSVQIGNFGANQLNSAQINWSVNGIIQTPFSWTGTLSPGDQSTEFGIGSYPLQPNDDLKAWTSLPNGVNDAEPLSDTARCTTLISVPAPDLGADTGLCNNTALLLNPGSYSGYLWSDGSTAPTFSATTAGSYWVTVTDAYNCTQTDTIVISILPAPPVPTITQNGSNLLSSAASGNQWLLNGVPIPGANTQLYIAVQSGTYTVEVTGSNGCVSISQAVIFVSVYEHAVESFGIKVFPNPNNGQFTLLMPEAFNNSEIALEIVDATGRIVFTYTDGNLQSGQILIGLPQALNDGIYLLSLTTSAGVINERLIILKTAN